MMIVNLVFPLLVLGGFAYYYFNVYKKGKAAGGGMMAGFRANEDEKWRSVLQPGETISVHGAGVLWRPGWQAFLASQMPVFRLFWPTVMHALVITNRDRVLIGRYGTLGAIKDPAGHPRAQCRIESATEEKAGLAAELNPAYQMFGADFKTFEAVLELPTAKLRLTGVPHAFVAAIQGGGQA